MARGDQLSRQWKIIQALSASRGGKSASQLAQTLSCHSRTVYRDLEALQQAGFPLYTERKNGKVHWALLDFGKKQLPIPLSLTELMALHFSRNMLKILQGTAIYESLVSLFDKVKATLPSQYLGYLDQVERSLEVGVKAYKPYADFKDTLTKVQQAVQNRTYIDMDYYTMSRRSLTRRRVAPYQVWFYDETFYLIAYCQTRREERLFAVDRIRDLTVLNERFDVPAGFDPETFMQHSFGVFRGDPAKVVIHFSPDAAGYVREKMWHPSQILDEQPDGSLIFIAEVAGIEEIKYWVLKWGAAATVIRPEALRRAVSAEAQAVVEHHAQAR
jgi:predicted DNA-binding transcriptional regulator YafY